MARMEAVQYSTGGAAREGKWVGAPAAAQGEQAGPGGAFHWSASVPLESIPDRPERCPLLQLLGCDDLKGRSRPDW